MPATYLELCLRLAESQLSVGQGAAKTANLGVKAELCCDQGGPVSRESLLCSSPLAWVWVVLPSPVASDYHLL